MTKPKLQIIKGGGNDPVKKLQALERERIILTGKISLAKTRVNQAVEAYNVAKLDHETFTKAVQQLEEEARVISHFLQERAEKEKKDLGAGSGTI